MEKNKFINIVVLVWVNICRAVLATVFILSGFIKANDPMGTVYKVQDYMEAIGFMDLGTGLMPYVVTWAIAMIEFTLGSYFLFGIRRRLASVFNMFFMLFMTGVTLWLAIDNPISDCGCFGDALTLTNWETFWKNICLMVPSVTLFFKHSQILKIVTNKMDWLVAMYSSIFIFLFTYYTFRNLPVFDFRPYHIGADINRGMEIPEGAKLSVYETIFTYEKNGEKKDFTIDNFPTDSTWKFVESRTILKENGYEPPIKDFLAINNDDGFDITETILGENYVFLLVAPWLEKADDSSMDLINELYDYSRDHGYGFYCVTASSDEAISRWQDYTGAEYPFATMDEITLKTMIRSNPGLVLLKDGVVINKWSNFSIPDEYLLTDSLDKLDIGHLEIQTVWDKLKNILAWFFGPLLLFIFVDLLWLGYQKKNKIVSSSSNNDKNDK